MKLRTGSKSNLFCILQRTQWRAPTPAGIQWTQTGGARTLAVGHSGTSHMTGADVTTDPQIRKSNTFLKWKCNRCSNGAQGIRVRGGEPHLFSSGAGRPAAHGPAPGSAAPTHWPGLLSALGPHSNSRKQLLLRGPKDTMVFNIHCARFLLKPRRAGPTTSPPEGSRPPPPDTHPPQDASQLRGRATASSPRPHTRPSVPCLGDAHLKYLF